MELSFSRSDAFSTGKRACCLLTDPRVIVAIELFATVYAWVTIFVDFRNSTGCISDNLPNETFLQECEESDLFVGTFSLAVLILSYAPIQCVISLVFIRLEWRAQKGRAIRGNIFTGLFLGTQFLDVLTDSMVIINVFVGAKAIERQREFSLKDYPWVISNVCFNLVSLLFSIHAIIKTLLSKDKELVRDRESISLQLFEKKIAQYENFLEGFKDFLIRNKDEVRIDLIVAGIIRPSQLETLILDSFWDKSGRLADSLFQNNVSGRELYRHRFVEAQNRMMKDILSDELMQYIDEANTDWRLNPKSATLTRAFVKDLDEVMLKDEKKIFGMKFPSSPEEQRRCMLRLCGSECVETWFG
mmetsp:Transcript_15351/g.20169  ORF Transcript_15351/g.20169 Transcript_15351/m.20169 type:complete len:358 (-) Transcript_15351:75-1148(-)